MAEKRIFDIETEATIDDITQKVYAWFDKKAQQGEVQEPSWKFDAYLLVKILNNFATKFVPNVLTVEGKCYFVVNLSDPKEVTSGTNWKTESFVDFKIGK